MPKTGSQTVEATLRKWRPDQEVVRFHFLSPQIARSLREALRSNQAGEQWKRDAREQLEQIRRIRGLIGWRRVLGWLRVRRPKLHVITGVREPIALALASTFENHSYLFPDLESVTPEACRTELLRPKALTHIQNWFNLELRRFIRIDVYQRPFRIAKGYAVYENSFARVLLYRSDFLSRLPAMLEEFLGWRVPGVISCNLGSRKSYGEAYADVKARLRLPREFVAAQYERPLMQHFFSEPERRQLLSRWTAPAEAAALSMVA